MTEPITNQTNTDDILARVDEGMDVYDRDGHKLGAVKDIYAGDVVDAPPGAAPDHTGGQRSPGNGSIVTEVARAFSDDLPAVLRSRLRHNGYVCIKGGFLGHDRYALREQVAAVEGRRVTLNVASNELIKA